MRVVDAATHPTAARRTRRRWVGPASLVLAATALLGAYTWFFKPLRIDWFYARTFAQLALDPQNAALTRASFATLLRYDRGELDREAQLAYDTFDYELSMQLEGAALRQRGTPPDDPAYYAWCVRWHTATELTPNQAHELGVAEVERLEADIAAVTIRRAPAQAGATGVLQIRRVSGCSSALPTPLAEAAAGAQRMTWAHHAIREAAQGKARTPDFAAYRDGLALYAAQLGAQARAAPDPRAATTPLRDALQRAARGVVDSGIHERRWTREQAHAYLLAHGALHAHAASGAIEHIVAHPGEALAAPLGLRKIRELHDHAAHALGTEFDLEQFHREVLRHGALPFSVLEGAIDTWIARRQAAAEQRPFAGG